MVAEGDALTAVEEELVRRLGRSIRMQRDGTTLVVTCGRAASVCISVDDPAEPSFAVSYPAFDGDAHTWKDLEQRNARRVLLGAVVAMVDCVVRDGAVLPEFPSSALRRSLRRGRTRQERG